jgi:hypothetical protein
LNNQTQAGVFTKGTKFSHGTMPNLPQARSPRQLSGRWKSGKKVPNDLK